MKLGEDEKHVFYRAGCDCMNKMCDLELYLHDDDGEVILEIDGDFVFDKDHLRGYRWYCRWWRWFKAVLRLIFTGRVEISTDFTFGSTEQIDHFILALSQGLNKIKDYHGTIRRENRTDC